ncbi:hypothetical protein [Roseinatronobacter sp. NSM]|uniref:hypothetical protein n=1 Tax=Roseinatronobacter sp. NSM TaxID=3457785 RepID=UPI0040352297
MASATGRPINHAKKMILRYPVIQPLRERRRLVTSVKPATQAGQVLDKHGIEHVAQNRFPFFRNTR